MVEALHLVENVKQYPGRVGDTARGQPMQAGLGQGRRQAVEIEPAGPTHAEIYRHLPDLDRAAAQQYLAENAARRQQPDDAENQEAVAIAQADQHEGRVGTGDQQIYRHMVENPEQFLQVGRAEAVVKRRHRVQQHQCQPEHGETRDDPRIARLHADGQQRAEPDQRQRGTDQMAYAIELLTVIHSVPRLHRQFLQAPGQRRITIFRHARRASTAWRIEAGTARRARFTRRRRRRPATSAAGNRRNCGE